MSKQTVIIRRGQGLQDPSRGSKPRQSAGEGLLDVALQPKPAGGAGLLTQEKEAAVGTEPQQRGGFGRVAFRGPSE